MKQCMNEIFAFGLNSVEFFTLLGLVLFCLGFFLIRYLNKGLGESKEDRWARDNPFLAVDMEMQSRRDRKCN